MDEPQKMAGNDDGKKAGPMEGITRTEKGEQDVKSPVSPAAKPKTGGQKLFGAVAKESFGAERGASSQTETATPKLQTGKEKSGSSVGSREPVKAPPAPLGEHTELSNTEFWLKLSEVAENSPPSKGDGGWLYRLSVSNLKAFRMGLQPHVDAQDKKMNG